MVKRLIKRIKLNFRQTHSERSAMASYKNYHKRIKGLFDKVKGMAKFNRERNHKGK